MKKQQLESNTQESFKKSDNESSLKQKSTKKRVLKKI